MPSLFIAFLLAVLTSIGVGVILTHYGVSTEMGVSLSAAIMAFVPQFREAIDKRKPTNLDPKIVSFGDFGLSSSRILFQASLSLFAVMMFAATVGALIAGLASVAIDQVIMVFGIVSFFTVFPFSYYIGRWIGVRCASGGVATVVLSVVLARVAAASIDVLLLTEEEYEEMWGRELSLLTIFGETVGNAILLSLISVIGYWRGRKLRLQAYMGYLFRKLPPDVRLSIVEMAYEESKRAT